jgi:hypothetical protein
MGVIIHIYMEIYKKTPCGATFISNKQDCHVFFFFLFSSTKSENKRAEQALRGGRWYQWEEGDVGKGVRG